MSLKKKFSERGEANVVDRKSLLNKTLQVTAKGAWEKNTGSILEKLRGNSKREVITPKEPKFKKSNKKLVIFNNFNTKNQKLEEEKKQSENDEKITVNNSPVQDSGVKPSQCISEE